MQLGRHGLFVLCYHRVNDEGDPFSRALPVSIFAQQLQSLVGRFEPAVLDGAPERVLSRTAGRPRVAITFDDGHRDVYTNVLPVLQRLGLPATVFLIGDCVARADAPWFDKLSHMFKVTGIPRLLVDRPLPLDFPLTGLQDRQRAFRAVKALLKEVSEETKSELLQAIQEALQVHDFSPLSRDLLRPKEIKELSEAGISFGAHTLTHPILSRVSLAVAAEEIARSKQIVEGVVGKPVTAFCYPNGEPADFNPEVKALVRKNGYRLACTTIPGVNSEEADPFELKRFHYSRGVFGALPIRVLAELRLAWRQEAFQPWP